MGDERPGVLGTRSGDEAAGFAALRSALGATSAGLSSCSTTEGRVGFSVACVGAYNRVSRSAHYNSDRHAAAAASRLFTRSRTGCLPWCGWPSARNGGPWSMILCERVTDFAIENVGIPEQFQKVGSVGMEVECQPERDLKCATMEVGGVMFDSSPAVESKQTLPICRRINTVREHRVVFLNTVPPAFGHFGESRVRGPPLTLVQSNKTTTATCWTHFTVNHQGQSE